MTNPDPQCFPNTLSLAFSSNASCCVQFPSAVDIALVRVYNSQVYWNSDPVANGLPCYGITTDTWFYHQFHLACESDGANDQIFRLSWCIAQASTQRDWTISMGGAGACGDGGVEEEWELVSSSCDPLSIEFRLLDGNWPPCCVSASVPADPEDPIPVCDLYATVTG